MKLNFKVLGGFVALSVAFSQNVNAHSGDTRSTVVDQDGRTIRSILSKSCVRTKWENGVDVCAEKVAAPVVAPTPAPAFVPVVEPRKPYVPKTLTLDSRSYQIFFDFDDSSLTDFAKKILDNLYNDTRAADTLEVNLIGHADRSGAKAYNMRLSEKRVNNAKKYLVNKGIPARNISIDWKGETSPLIPTIDGIREAQNRRVDIQVETTIK